MEATYDNKILKIACFLMLAFTLVALGFSIFNASSVVSQTQNIDSSTQGIIQQQIDSTNIDLSVDEVAGFASLVGIVGIAFAVIAAIPRIVAGIMGLFRTKDPQRYNFFNVWGIILLVLGVIGTFLSGIVSPIGICNLISSVVAPVLFIIGAKQHKDTLQQQSQQYN